MRRFVPVLLLCVVVTFSACREQTKEDIYQQGMAFVTAGNYQAAITLFKDALEKDPNYLDARIQLGVAYLETKKLDKAESELEKVLRQDPENPSVALRLAEIYLGTSRPEKAVLQLENLQKSDPKNSEVLRLLANSHAVLGELTVAEELFRESLVIEPDNYRGQLGLVQLLYAAGRNSEGDRLLAEAMAQEPDKTDAYYLSFRRSLAERDQEGSLSALEKIRAINPDDIAAAYMLGMLYLDTGKIDSARQIAANLTTRHPGHPAGDRIDGVALYLTDDYEAAIQKLQKSINGMPDLPGFYFLGLANYRFGQMEQALSNFQKALDKSPDHEQSRLMVAQTFLKQGRIDDCARQAELVLERNSSSANAHNILGSAYLLQGKYDLAMEHIDKALQINPELAQAHLKKGIFNLASGKNKQGELDLLNAVNAAPEILNTRLLLATYYLRQNNYPMALQVLEKGLTISPDSAVIYNIMAAAQFGQNKHKQAIESLEKAKALKPDFFTPYFNLANYHISRKDYPAALHEYQEVLKVAPNHVQAMLKAATLHELLDQNDLAEDFYKKAANTQNPQGYIALASFQHRRGNKAAALETLKAGYAALPDNPDLMVVYAETLKNSGQFDEAILVYTHLEELHPGVGKPLLLGIHLLKGDFAAAKEIADREISEKPSSPQGYLFQSAIHEKRSEWQLAEKSTQKGIQVADNNLPLKINLARLYTKRGATEDALKIYDDILRDTPSQVSVIFAKAAIYDVAGDKKKAQNLYETILTLDENHVPALNNLALLLTDIHANNKRALELAGKAFRLKSNDSRIMDTLGYVLLKNGQVEKSIVFLEKAASITPDEAQIQIHLARAYKAAGRNQDAIASLSAINQSNAPEAQIREVKALLNELN